ncbi:NUDIX hydrolase [Segetibacter aerophilus]|uniref:ADP-ribose pyrophosphatase n=1 Tax=Segetibacter aerophilus TaxID=670293 RepID=A0A512BH37_9BACT|nr:NUDIX hydrolase [Segetibacter aerophilus]GEO11269.1 ADP-ribose pyrophosphatase [Segetibacter aerophilus]
MGSTQILHDLQRLKSLADIGLLYSKDEYDKERYLELQQIGWSLLSQFSNTSFEEVKAILPPAKDYPTAKVDIRGLMISENKKVLLVKESMDGKWSLPGGWGDIGYSPKETIVKEFKEETGLDVIPERLLAVFDKKMHAHPPQAFYVYKMVFLCKPKTIDISKGFDVLDVQYFPMDSLPELSQDRILESQIKLLATKVFENDHEVYVD